MADTRTDAQANAEDNDGLDLFTSATPVPRSPAGNIISQTDESLFRSLKFYAYRDMRAQFWVIKWGGSSWNAYPTKATAAHYNAEYGLQMDPRRMYAAASDSQGMIDAIEERIEAARVNKPSGGGLWVILLVLALALSKEKKR